MRALVRLWPLALVGGIASCAFLLDYDELQSGSDDAGADVSSGGGPGGSGGGPTGGTGGGGTAGSGGSSTGGQSGTGGDAGTDAPTGTPLGKLAAELAKAGCANAKACYGPAVELATKGLDCEQWVTALLEDVFIGAIEPLTDAGVVYDPMKGAQCVAELAAKTTDAGVECVELSKIYELCKAALSGLKTSGSCKSTIECAAGLYCDTSSSCPGTCQPYLKESSPCATTTQCDAGLTCFVPKDLEAGAADSGASLGTCKPYTKVGNECQEGKEPECAPGAICAGTGSWFQKKCFAAASLFTAPLGLSCYGNGLYCQPGLACEFQGWPFWSAASCVKDTLNHAADGGSGCRIAIPDGCGQGAYCTAPPWAEGQCVGLPTKTQQCAKDTAQGLGLVPPCLPPLICVNGTCQDAVRLGNGCGSHAQCVSGYCKGADAGSGVCAPPACE